MTDDKVCRVLIVDDDLEYAAKVADELKRVRPELLGGNRLQIELSNTAYFVAAQLLKCSPAHTPWDVIIADAYMPLPCARRGEPAEETAIASFVKSSRGVRYRCWLYNYSWNRSPQLHELEHGAMYIAEKLEKLNAGTRGSVAVKLLVISAAVSQMDKEALQKYQCDDRGWFKYYDKGRWEDMKDWPSAQKPDVFQWALVQAISERESPIWADKVFDGIDPRIMGEKAATYARKFVTMSPGIQKVLVEARSFASDMNVRSILLFGESGTGKEVLAHLIHQIRQEVRRSSGMPTGAFIPCPCPTIPEHLFESTVFGHKKGAFSDAKEDKKGLVQEAENGTFFMDEIADLSPPHQAKFLRFVETSTFRRVGDNELLRVPDVLVVCATNREQIDDPAYFRDDLRSRLEATITIPPLRERRDDIVPLAALALEIAREDVFLTDEAKEWLRDQEWPRNARQLIDTVYLAGRHCLGRELTVIDLERALQRISPVRGYGAADKAATMLEDLTPQALAAGDVPYDAVQSRYSGAAGYKKRLEIMLAAEYLRKRQHSQIKWPHKVQAFFSEARRQIKRGNPSLEEVKDSLLRSLAGEKREDVEEFLTRFLEPRSQRGQ